MKKILVVDDEKPISDIIKFNMAKEGYEVLTAFDGKEALEMFEAEQPDILILDLMLPEVDGLDVARTIRKTSNVPIIVLSAKDSEFDKVIGLEIGADDYVTKPFDNNVFLAKVQGLLRRSYEFGTDQSLLEYQGVILNLKSMDLVYEGELVTLTKNEFLKHHLYSRRFILSLLLIVFSIMGMFAFIFEDGRSLLEYQLLLAFLLASFFLGMDIASAYKEYRNQLFYASGRPQTALEALLFEKLALLEMDKKNRAIEEREKLNDLMDYYTLWAHQIKTPIAASSLLVGEIEDKKVKNQLEQELFKIESYVNIVLQYLRLESFHEDLVLKKENVEDLVKEIVKKYAIFFIQKGLSLNLHDLDRIANYIRHDSRQLVNHLNTGIFLLDQTSELHRVREYAIQRHVLQCCRWAFGKRSDVLNNFVDACSLISNLSIDLQHLSLVYFRRPVNHFQCCIGISGNRGERLINFVCNRRGHLAERNEARRVFHLTGLLFEFLLIDFSLSDVQR